MRHPTATVADPTPTWQERLDRIVAMMREMSVQTEPEAMVRAYGARIQEMMPTDRRISLSRRGLEYPRVRVTRDSRWTEPINPWLQKDRLPMLEGGFVSELVYGEKAQVINDLRLDSGDPAAPYLEDMRSLMALPNFDGGVALNWVLALREEPGAFDPEDLPDRVWMSNLFGRATSNLVLKEELRRAYEVVDRELRHVADIQRALLPRSLPRIPHLNLAAHYQTSTWAGGDYYDFFEMPGGKWGLLIADVSGHGTPAAVLMAITHALAHGHPGHPEPPAALLTHVNERLTNRYTTDTGTFVTAFYGIFDPVTLELTYSCAGHNPPRLKRCVDGTIASLDVVGGLPLGLFNDHQYGQATITLRTGDQIVFYTDGITDATDPSGQLFGLERLDDVLNDCHEGADGLIRAVLDAVERFTQAQPAEDDRTLLIAKVN